MGRRPCCSKEGLNRGAWTALEDKILTAYIKAHGEGKWRNLPKRAGLKRCGKSCRLRWLNYLRPDIKRGNISDDEEELIVRLHKLLGNRWSLIAGRLPGRTDNEIKNYWNTTLGKKATALSSPPMKSNKSSPPSNKPKTKKLSEVEHPKPSSPQVIRTKATRCTKVLVSPLLQGHQTVTSLPPVVLHQQCYPPLVVSSKPLQDDVNNDRELQARDREEEEEDPPPVEFDYENDFPAVPGDSILALEGGYWTSANVSLEDNASCLDLESLAFLFDSDDWSALT